MVEEVLAYGYAGLFVISFLAATILPIGSEVFFAAMLVVGYDPLCCLFWASLGNTLGGMVNYWLGCLGKTEWIEKYLKVSSGKLRQVQVWLRYKGAWAAFFSFLPAVGDLIPLGLGFMRANGWITAAAMLLGKAARYGGLVYGTEWGIRWLEA